MDRAWRGAYGTLARYADDALVMCRSKGQAVAALARLTELLAELGLKPKLAKTRIVKLEVGGEGVDFLGFHHRLVRSRARRGRGEFTFLARCQRRVGTDPRTTGRIGIDPLCARFVLVVTVFR